MYLEKFENFINENKETLYYENLDKIIKELNKDWNYKGEVIDTSDNHIADAFGVKFNENISKDVLEKYSKQIENHLGDKYYHEGTRIKDNQIDVYVT